MHMRDTHHFHRGPLLSTPKKRKEFQRNTQKYFWSFFCLFLKEVKQEREKKITRESSQQAKEEREIFLGFLSNYYYYDMESKLAKSYN